MSINRDLTHPSHLGAFAGDGLLDPWLADPESWYGALLTLVTHMQAHGNVQLPDHPAPTAIIASMRIGETDGQRTFAILLRTIADARQQRDAGGCWIQLVDEPHRRTGQIRDDWLAHRNRLRAEAVDVVEVDLLRLGEPLHPRPATAAWSIGWRPCVGEQEVIAGGIRDPLPALGLPASNQVLPGRRHRLDLPGIMRRHATDSLLAQVHVDYRRPLPPGLPDTDAAWAMDRVAAWRARGGPGVRR